MTLPPSSTILLMMPILFFVLFQPQPHLPINVKCKDIMITNMVIETTNKEFTQLENQSLSVVSPVSKLIKHISISLLKAGPRYSAFNNFGIVCCIARNTSSFGGKPPLSIL